MKCFFFFLFFVTNLYASIETLRYKVSPGQYHSGGSLEATVTKVDNEKKIMEVQIKYDIIKRPLIPAPANLLKNTMTFELPLDFQDERGYLNLELDKTKDMGKVTVQYAGRVSLGKLSNAHHVKIRGKNGKYVCDIYYHPSLPELGWSKIGLWLNLALLSNYQMNADLVP